MRQAAYMAGAILLIVGLGLAINATPQASPWLKTGCICALILSVISLAYGFFFAPIPETSQEGFCSGVNAFGDYPETPATSAEPVEVADINLLDEGERP